MQYGVNKNLQGVFQDKQFEFMRACYVTAFNGDVVADNMWANPMLTCHGTWFNKMIMV